LHVVAHNFRRQIKAVDSPKCLTDASL